MVSLHRLLLLALVALSALALCHAADSQSLNEEGLRVAQANPPDFPRAARLFNQAVEAERSTLRSLRRDVRDELALLDAAAESSGSEVDEESSDRLLSLRADIRASKDRLANYLNNAGVTAMRENKLRTARRILLEAQRVRPQHVDVERNLEEVDDLLAQIANNSSRGKKKRRAREEEDEEEEMHDEDEEISKPKKKNGKKKQGLSSPQDDDGPPRKRRPQPMPAAATNGAKDEKKRRSRLPAMDRPRRPNTNVRAPFPRIHIDHLYWPENEQYALGREPFILLGALDSWDPERHWTPSTLARNFPDATVDFYPHNMDKSNVRPFLTPIARAVAEQANPSGAFPQSEDHPGSYIQWNVNRRDWENLIPYMGGEFLPAIFRQDWPWMRNQSCLTPELQDEYSLRVHWRMVIIGNRGAGMFNHQDVLRTSSWQAQLFGAKRWHICSPTQSRFLYRAGDVDAFDPDYTRFPLFAQAQCMEDVVEGGEMIFYPADWWHQTENVRTPSISASSSVIDHNNHALIATELGHECANKKYNWGFSTALCEALTTKCFPLWKQIYAQPFDVKKAEEDVKQRKAEMAQRRQKAQHKDEL